MALLAVTMAHIQNGLVDVCMLVIVSNSRENCLARAPWRGRRRIDDVRPQ
jgi:hypothetical protein